MVWTRNVGMSRQTFRLRVGVLLCGVALVSGVLLRHTEQKAAIHALLYALFFTATSSIGQGLSGTDVWLAARGLRDMDGVREPIADAAELERVRVTARRVVLIAAGSAAALTAVLALASR